MSLPKQSFESWCHENNENLLKEWHPTKNGDYTPSNTYMGMKYRPWWICSEGHEWQAQINERCHGRGCAICSGRRVLAGFNDLESQKPEISKEWHPTKNRKKPSEYVVGSNLPVWWMCPKGHEWEAKISDRTYKGGGCPYCSGKRVLPGFNDLASCYPVVADEWNYEKNGDLRPDAVTKMSNTSVYWRCKDCGHEWKARIADRAQGKGCPQCRKGFGVSFEEKAIVFYLSDIVPLVENYKADFLGRMELDVFIPSLRIGIEYDGASWHTSKEYDERKNRLCIENDIELIRVMESDSERDGSINIHVTKRDRKSLSDAIHRILVIISEKSGDNYAVDVDVEKDAAKILEKKYTYRRERSLGVLHPELARQLHPTKNGLLNAEMIPVKSNFELWWICDKGHEWKAVISSRVMGRGCPYCSHTMLLPGFNDLATTNPELAKEWHPTKNGELKPDQVMMGSSDKVWWMCSEGHEWEAIIYSRKKNGCPICANRVVLPGYNDLATTNPELAKEWHPTKNGDITPSMVVSGSNVKYWWVCKNGHEIFMAPSARTSGKYCGVCDGKVVVPGINDLESQYPEMAGQWHPTKNGKLKPSQVAPHSNKPVWWLCENGHDWRVSPNQRIGRKYGCPYCSNQKVWPGFNDLESRYPELAKQWHPTKNGELKPSMVTPGSSRKVWWKCPRGHEWEAMIQPRTKRNVGCPYCSKQRK